MEEKRFRLEQKVDALCQRDLLAQSRVHPLSGFCPGVWMKREDESGFGVSGGKRRKYASLLPWLVQKTPSVIGLIGGANSNHLVAMMQLLRERSMPFELFVKASHQKRTKGNAFLIDLLMGDVPVHWVETTQWSQVMKRAQETLPPDAVVLPEGGSCAAAVPGAASLMLDILRNEGETGQQFDHIFVDSGTGLSAAALCLANAALGRECHIHVVQMADGPAFFTEKLQQVHQWWHLLGLPDTVLPEPIVYASATAASFGSVNASVLTEVRRMAKEEGILVDPIYMAKLCLTVRSILSNRQLSGQMLVVHSGGGTGLMGFDEKLQTRD
ncbi:MAG: pyridoxal-phosphate dependent enzyme [Bacteroidota bacterium]